MKKNYILYTVAFAFSVLTLNAQNNSLGKFYSIEQALKNPDEVKELKINNVDFKEISKDISFQNLEKLDLSQSGLQTISNDIKLPKLRVLKLDNVDSLKLQEVLIALSESKLLEEIYLSNCRLNYLPHEIGNFSELKILDVSNNNIKNLPHEIGNLVNLESLNVSYNSLIGINNKLIFCHKLEQLNIAFNDSVNEEKDYLVISFLNNIQHLTIGGLTELETSLTQLQNIEKLSIVESDFLTLPEGSEIYLNNLKSLSLFDMKVDKVLSLFTSNNIESLEIINCTNFNSSAYFNQQNNISLKELTIISSGLQEIPKTISEFKNLRKINFKRNNIKTLPIELVQLKNLKVLDVKNNAINPKNVEKLNKLNNEIIIDWDFYEDYIVDQKATDVKKIIAPPIKGLNVPQINLKFNNTEANQVEMESGTTINIPKNAFLNVNGNIVEGEVDITYREFLSPVDFLISGIPLSYDSAGVTYNFSSAGQVEFRASVNGMEVFPNPNSLIEINLASKNNDPNMNLYLFNEDKGNWEIMNQSIVQSDVKETIKKDSITPISSTDEFMRLPQPVFIDVVNFYVKKDSKIKSFKISFQKLNIKYDTKDIRKPLPELYELNKYEWIYDGANLDSVQLSLDSISDFLKYAYKKFKVRNKSNRELYERDTPNFIKDVDLVANPNDDNYLLSIYMFNDTLTLPVYPKITSSYPEMVQRKNKQFYKTYLSTIQRKNKSWTQAENKYDKALVKCEKNYQKYGVFSPKNMNLVKAENAIRNSFRLLSFGVLNCDKIQIMREPEPMIAEFVDDEGNTIMAYKTFIIDKTTMSIIPYSNLSNAYFDRKSENSIVLLMDDNKMGIVESSVFRAAIKNGKRKIKTKIINQEDINIVNLERFI